MEKLTAEKFIAYCGEVVNWNEVSLGGEHCFSPQTELKQLSYCLEEVGEAVKGYEDEDLIETLDGLADSAVTLSYLVYLVYNGKGDCFDYLEGHQPDRDWETSSKQ